MHLRQQRDLVMRAGSYGEYVTTYREERGRTLRNGYYRFIPPTQPLAQAEYEALRQEADLDFSRRLAQAKKRARPQFWRELRTRLQLRLPTMISCVLYSFFLKWLYPISWDTFPMILLLMLSVPLFFICRSLLVFISGGFYVAALGRHLQRQRAAVLRAASYADYLASWRRV